MILTLPDIIENAARSFPKGEAFSCGSDTLTFQELDTKADQLASYLRSLGVCKGDRVGVYMDRCLETVIAIYGIMKSGAVYVPLDPLSPQSRTIFLLEDCIIGHLVTTPKQTKKIIHIHEVYAGLQSVIGLNDGKLNVSVSWETIFAKDLKDYDPIPIISSDLAYIMYTSGSTGAPKGIMHTHHSSLAYAKLSADVYGLLQSDRVATHAPLHFDISTFGYFSVPLAGATSVIVPDAYTKMPASLSSLMEKEQISIWYSVPLALIQLLLNGVLEKRDLNALRWVLFGGEVFAPKYLRQLMELWPHATFCNVYGPAEINQCTYHHLKTPPHDDEQIPLGKIWRNTAYKIIDTKDQEVPRGNPGELVVRTETMMRGYWNNEELTNDSFFKEIVATGFENTYYRTGDIVLEKENGDLTFVGRNDRQVKIRGYRVEIDEIEGILIKHDLVTEAVVSVLDGEIAAAVIPVAKSELTTADLKGFCQQQLPSYAVPDHINFLTDFPRTSSGKIKRSEIHKIIIG